MEGRGTRRFVRAMTWLAMAFLYVPLAIVVLVVTGLYQYVVLIPDHRRSRRIARGSKACALGQQLTGQRVERHAMALQCFGGGKNLGQGSFIAAFDLVLDERHSRLTSSIHGADAAGNEDGQSADGQ